MTLQAVTPPPPLSPQMDPKAGQVTQELVSQWMGEGNVVILELVSQWVGRGGVCPAAMLPASGQVEWAVLEQG